MLRNLDNKNYTHFTNLNEFPKELSFFQKVGILAEQFMFAKYLNIIEPKNDIYNKFLISMRSKYELNTDIEINTNEERTIFHKLGYFIFSDNISPSENIKEFFYNPKYQSKYNQLPKQFIEPLLHFMYKVSPDKKDASAILLYPKVYTDKNQVYVTFDIEQFNSFDYDTKEKSNYNDEQILDLIYRYNWNGNSFGEVVDTMFNLSPFNCTKYQLTNSTLGFINKTMLHIDKSKLEREDRYVNTFFYFMSKLHQKYGMVTANVKQVYDIMSKTTTYPADTIDYLMASDPTLAQQRSFDNFRELSFLNDAVKDNKVSIKYGKEGLEGGDNVEQDDASGTVEPETEVTVEINEETTTETDSEDTGIDDFGDDTGDTDGGEFSEETTDDTDTSSSDDLDTGSGEATKETDTIPADPTTIALNVMLQDPTFDTIMYRKNVEKLITKLVANPPENMPSYVVQALRSWSSQWLYIMAPATTKRFMSLVLADYTKE